MRIKQTLKDLTPYIKGVVILYAVSLFIGILLSDKISPFVNSFLKGILTEVKTKTYLETASFLFLNNARAAALAVLLGPLLALYPLFATSLNGLMLGSAAATAWAKSPALLWRIVPHGIFEVPAILLSFALGAKTGIELLLPPKKGTTRRQTLKNNIKESLAMLLTILLPVILLAALIEAALIK